MEFEQHEGHSGHRGDDEQPDDQRRTPAARIALDQGIDECEQGDAGREQSGDVEPLLLRRVL